MCRASQSVSARMASSVLVRRECVYLSMLVRSGGVLPYHPGDALTKEPVASLGDFEAMTLPMMAPRMMAPIWTGGT